MRFKGYKFSFRINASHKTNDNAEHSHSHTFEIALFIKPEHDFQAFYEVETLINEQINRYSGKCFNDIPPFDSINPTVENIGNIFFDDIYTKIAAYGFCLFQLNISETPNRIYSVCDFELTERKKAMLEKARQEMIMPAAVNDVNEKAVPEETGYIPNKPDFLHKKPDMERKGINSSAVKLESSILKNYVVNPYVFPVMVIFVILGGFIAMLLVKNSGYYPLGFDIHGHLFKSDLMYQEIKEGNLYPLYTQYWYNGLQPYRYWPPMPYYFMSVLQFLSGGDVMKAYLGFVWASFSIGGFGWLLFGKKLNRPVLGALMAFLWFLLPDNMRVFFGEGNLPRMFITMLLPLIFYFIWQVVYYKRDKMIIPLIVIMVFAVFGHLMISAMVGVGTFVFLLIYSVKNKEYRQSSFTILAMLFSFAVCGIWVYPGLVGGITAMDSGGTSDLMASLATKLSISLNPLLRLENGITELYFGLSIAITAIIGLLFSNKKSSPGFVSLLIVIAGTTTALTPLIQKIPFSELFWVRRFAPIGYAIFIIGLFEWKKLKKPFMVFLCLLITIDCIPSANLKEFDKHMGFPGRLNAIPQEMENNLYTQAKEITKQRVSLMDLSLMGPMPSYAFGTLENKTPYVFGWAWQGAATAENIVEINEAIENQNFDFLFDRNKELGADTVIIYKNLIKPDYYGKLYDSAGKLDYRPVSESDSAILFSLDAEGMFGVRTTYSGLAIGTTSAIVPQLFPYFGTGDYEYIDEYKFEDLSSYKKLYLSGFFYRNKSYAEELVRRLAESGVEIFIDMSNIPSDPLTTRMTFLDISAQPIAFTEKYPELIMNEEVVTSEPFVSEHELWNTVYLNQLGTTIGYSWFENQKLDFLGRDSEYDNITYIGFNLLYHSLSSGDSMVYGLLNDIIYLDEYSLPERSTVPLDITYNGNKITIVSPEDNVNTTLAYQDNFTSDSEIRNVRNLLVVDKGATVIDITYPYFTRGIIITAAGIITEVFIVFFMLKPKKTRVSRKSRNVSYK